MPPDVWKVSDLPVYFSIPFIRNPDRVAKTNCVALLLNRFAVVFLRNINAGAHLSSNS
jgi:hypothetical protein